MFLINLQLYCMLNSLQNVGIKSLHRLFKLAMESTWDKEMVKYSKFSVSDHRRSRRWSDELSRSFFNCVLKQVPGPLTLLPLTKEIFTFILCNRLSFDWHLSSSKEKVLSQFHFQCILKNSTWQSSKFRLFTI